MVELYVDSADGLVLGLKYFKRLEPLPLRMRRRIIELYCQGKQTHEIAAILGTCRSGTRRIRQLLPEQGTLEPRRPKTGPVSGQWQAQLRELAAADPGATREQPPDRLGVSVDVRTVGR